MTTISSKDVLEVEPQVLHNLNTHSPGPQGKLPLTPTKLLNEPSGNLFALSQNAGMGWPTEKLLDPEFLILSTSGGLRAEDGTPVALGFHTGHWEVGLLVAEAAREFRRLRAIPFAAACTDPCDGRSQGTEGMLDSLPYRNDAATVLRRLMRSLPTRRGVMGIATCDKGLPAMMMALASSGDYPAVLVPGASRCCRSGAKMPAKRRRSVPVSRNMRFRWSTHPRSVAVHAPLRAEDANFLGPPRRRRSRLRLSALPCRPPRWRHPGMRSGLTTGRDPRVPCCDSINLGSARPGY